MNLITPELMNTIVDERRRLARTIRLQQEVSRATKPSRLRRMVASALAIAAGRIHFESAHGALHSATER